MKQCVKIKVFIVNYFILHISTYYTIIILLYYIIINFFFLSFIFISIFILFYFIFILFFESFDLPYFERTPRHDTPIWKCVSAVAVRL